jgi:hypothetical protein
MGRVMGQLLLRLDRGGTATLDYRTGRTRYDRGNPKN